MYSVKNTRITTPARIRSSLEESRNRFSKKLGTVMDQQPVQIRPDGETDGDPRLDQARQIDRAGQTHDEPAGHVGCSGAESCDPRRQVPAAEHVVLVIGRAAEGQVPDQQHGCEIEPQRNEDENLIGHHRPFVIDRFPR
jgi:hypothetical protein